MYEGGLTISIVGMALALLVVIGGTIRPVLPKTMEQHMGRQDITSAEDFAAWMQRMNLSITAAAEQLGRKRATLSRYLKGITDLPQSVAHHASIIEAARHGQPFPSRSYGRPGQAAAA
jgi:hypothetical protein